MSKRLLLLLVLSACVLAYRAADVWLAVSDARRIEEAGQVGFDDGRLVLESVRETDLEGRPAPAFVAGLRSGDALVAIETPDGRRIAADSMAAVGRALGRVHVGDSWAIIAARRGSGGQVSEIRAAMESHPRSVLRLGAQVLLVGALPLLAVGTTLLIGFLKPDDPGAFLAGLLFLGFSSLFGSTSWGMPPGLREIGLVVHTTLASTFTYVFMRFFLVFPAPGAIDRRLPWLKHVGLVFVAVLACGSLVLSLAGTYSFAAAARVASALDAPRFESLLPAAFLVMLLIGLVSGVWQAVGAGSPDERRRLGILIAGAAAGLLPFLALVVYVMAAGQPRVAMWMLPIILLTLPVFPLSFIYAVVRHRVLGVSLIVRRGLQYALVSRGVLVVEGVSVFFGLFLVVGPLMSRAVPDVGVGGIAVANAMAALVAVVGLERMNRRMRMVIDRRFFREPYNAQRVLSDLATDLQESARDPLRIAAAFATRLTKALHVARIDVLVSEPWLEQLAGAAQSGRQPGQVPSFVRVATAGLGWEGGGDGEPARVAGVDAGLAELPPDASGDAADVVDVATPLALRGLVRTIGARSGRAHRRGGVEWLRESGVQLLVPFRARGTLLGWARIGDKLSEEAYSTEDKALIRAAARQTAVALDYTTLIGRVAEQERLRRELDVARQVQAGLLPRRRPVMESCDYEGACRMAREIGGDYFDFIEVAPGRLGVAVGDISGKGVSAALLMASLQALLRSRARQFPDDPARLVADVNMQLVDSVDPSKFATFFYGVLDSSSRTLTYVNAGHNPPLLVRAEGREPTRLPPTGWALGFEAGARYAAATASLGIGDLLVVFTDGATDALNAGGDEFGEDRLIELVVSHRHLEARALTDLILARVAAFCGDLPAHDDITVVVVKGR